MAFKRRYQRRSRSFLSGPSLIKAGTVLARSKAFQGVLKNALGLNTETHWLDTIETNIGTSSTAGLMAALTVIPQGDTVNTRSGNSVRLTSLVCRGRIEANTAALTPTQVRVLLVKYPYSHGVSFGATTVLDSATRITSHYNMGDAAGAGNYTILYDRTFDIAVSGNDSSIKHFEIKYKPKNHHLKWDSSDTTGASSALIEGSIRGIIMTSEAGANTPNYWADWRVKFVDN